MSSTACGMASSRSTPPPTANTPTAWRRCARRKADPPNTMKAISRDVWLALGLFVVLAAITVAAAVRQSRQADALPLDSKSSAPTGAAALRIWLGGLGYGTQPQIFTTHFSIPPLTKLVLLLEPTVAPTDAEWEELEDWINSGGTLVVAGSDFAAS